MGKKKQAKHTIDLYFPHKLTKSMMDMKPKERLEAIAKKRRSRYKLCKKLFGKDLIDIKGSKNEPAGVTLIQNDKNESIIAEHKWMRDNYHSSDDVYEEGGYYLFLGIATFVIQIENKKKGSQNIEERILIVESTTEKKARKKLLKEFKDYQKPYLNGRGEMVRWAYANDLEVYNTYLTLEDMIHIEEGLEVYSFLSKSKITKETRWER